jgi:hypothetical protein
MVVVVVMVVVVGAAVVVVVMEGHQYPFPGAIKFAGVGGGNTEQRSLSVSQAQP